MRMNFPFEAAVVEHRATVLHVCRAILGYGADADDAWSETFLAALRLWPDLPETTNVEAWLVRVAQRKCIDITRTQARQAIPTAELPEQVSAHGNPGVEDAGLWEEVAKLPERQRLAVAYHYLGGLSHVETADLLGVTPAAVRRASADGIMRLRKIYVEKEELRDDNPDRHCAIPGGRR